jgi:hypothetical protein
MQLFLLLVPPSIKFISAVVAVTPSKIFISVAVEVTATSSFIFGEVKVLFVSVAVEAVDQLNEHHHLYPVVLRVTFVA